MSAGGQRRAGADGPGQPGRGHADNPCRHVVPAEGVGLRRGGRWARRRSRARRRGGGHPGARLPGWQGRSRRVPAAARELAARPRPRAGRARRRTLGSTWTACGQPANAPPCTSSRSSPARWCSTRVTGRSPTMIREHYSDAVAIDMESAGVAEAAHHNEFHQTIMVRAISDRADGNKRDHRRGRMAADRRWQRRRVRGGARRADRGPAGRPRPVGVSPYRGLAAFVEQDEALFFGRTETADELAALVATRRFVAVVGRSGSGKSSLVQRRAGAASAQERTGRSRCSGPARRAGRRLAGRRPAATVSRSSIYGAR